MSIYVFKTILLQPSTTQLLVMLVN